MAFWIFCTLILMIGRATDSELGYDPGEPFCGNATTCASLNMMNVALDRSTAAGVFFSTSTHLSSLLFIYLEPSSITGAG